MTELQTKIKLRSAIKGQLTRFKNFLDKANPNNLDLDQLKLRLAKAEPLWDDFNSVQTEIELLHQGDPDHAKERDSFEESYFETISNAKKLIPKEPTVSISNDNGSLINVNNHNSLAEHSNIKLPTLNLPTFDGCYSHWLFFRDTFKSIIAENSQIPNIQKFHYLRVSLKGEAADVIRSLEVSAANYDTAWKLLLERYENKPLLINNHVKSLLSLPSMIKESHSGLRQLLDGMSKHLGALEVLEQPVDKWDTLIIHIISSKLDNVTKRQWEAKNTNGKLPKLEDFSNFLKETCRLLENLGLSDQNKHSHFKPKNSNSFLSTSSLRCSICQGDHIIYYCNKFLSLEPNTRFKEAKRLKLCINCLRKGHDTKDCRSSKCKKCKQSHNTLLHFPDPTNSCSSTQVSPSEVVNNDAGVQSGATLYGTANILSCTTPALVLLSTAVVEVFDNNGQVQHCRAILDSGSQTSFITHKLSKLLKLHLNQANFSVNGITANSTNINYKTQVKIKSRLNNFHCSLGCLVVPKITGNVPQFNVNHTALNVPGNIILADPEYYKPSEIDLLIGADIYWDLLSVGQIRLGKNLPTLQKTQLGWIVSGKVNSNYIARDIHCNLSTMHDLNNTLAKFWEVESYNNTKHLSFEEKQCETHFAENTFKNSSGRFIVSLPLKESTCKLGDSKQTALHRLFSMEKRLSTKPELKSEYINFMREYESLQHMSEITNSDDNEAFYLPHHCVVKSSSSTTKLRVVFDGSSKSTSGYSINDLMMIGPTIQHDLLAIILRFRTHKIALTADIAKMYRQVLVHPNHRKLQRILWREQPNDNVRCFELNTVTYGTAAASYLAIRCLHQTAHDHAHLFPAASSVILQDFYVDDLLTGGATWEEVIQIKNDVTKILQSGGFQLRKWLSNHSSIIQENCASNSIIFGEKTESKTLGLLWQPSGDTLAYDIKLQVQNRVTKRSIMSSIAQIFDPLGLLSPVTVTAKILLQKLWQYKLNWDESVPQEIHTKWISLRSNLICLNQLKIPRYVFCSNAPVVEVHGFSDSSEAAYGACIYIKTIDQSGKCHSNLMVAKTRVAPLKTLTIPRLELCGALLLAELFSKLKESIRVHITSCYFWTDSKIVLSWIKSSPHLWKIFIANRVTEIQNLTNANDWHYINTADNPADILSRGIDPLSLLDLDLWWRGPIWLHNPESQYPITDCRIKPNECPEIRNQITTLKVTASEFDLFSKFSKLTKLQRVVGYVLRFRHNISVSPSDRKVGPLTVLELKHSLNRLVHLVQMQCFSEEIRDIKDNKPINSKSSLRNFSPFLDQDKLLRVGGRIKNSDYDYNKKHPLILPKNHPFTTLIAEHEHIRLLHAGPQAMLASLRERFWPLAGRNLVKKVYNNCKRCFRFEARSIQYKMGDLPRERLQPSRPFLVSGLDYAGPFSLRDRKGRNSKITKAYICLFICFSTRAIHLEVVGDLTTQSFLAALRRFMSRRGKCSKIYSDNASTFVGAKSTLSEFLKIQNDEISTGLAQDGVQWHFIPPRAPHFGGLWEAGIKRVKFHLKRVVGESIFTFEEFLTIVTQIEACLNSRPLWPISNNPNDLQPLTPAHFLVGESLTALPEPCLLNTKENRLSRFEHMQQIVQSFWRRWSKEFISELQQRQKWQKSYPTLLQPGTLVIIKEDNTPPLQWKLGRVMDVHPGGDGVIRTATLRTKSGLCKRPATKLCVLPGSNKDF